LPRNFQILLVEDNPADARLLQEVFSEVSSDITFRVANDGAEGLEMLSRLNNRNHHPDLVLLDLNLPKISGHEVLAIIKKDPKTCCIPVIVLTSSRAEADIRRAYESHANAYLRKPSTLDGLISAARQINNFWLETATLPN
jgi:chemotaxis family two-component system response regulator Rcp1